MATEEASFEFGLGTKRYKDAAKGLEVLAQRYGKSINVAAPTLVREMHSFLDAVKRALVRRHSTPWTPGGSPPDKLYRRRGSVAKIRTHVRGKVDINRIVGKMVIPFPLSVHEEGARIVARRVQYLTIPLPTALNKRGIPLRKTARGWDNTFVKRSRRGSLLIFQRRGATIVPLYVLKREVQLPARLGVSKTFAAGEQFFVDNTVNEMAKAIQNWVMFDRRPVGASG